MTKMKLKMKSYQRRLLIMANCGGVNHGAELYLKVLGCSVSFQILEEKVKELWRFFDDCELLDLHKGYCLVHFYSYRLPSSIRGWSIDYYGP